MCEINYQGKSLVNYGLSIRASQKKQIEFENERYKVQMVRVTGS